MMERRMGHKWGITAILLFMLAMSVRAQQTGIVCGKVLNHGRIPVPFPSGEKVYILAFNTVEAARNAMKIFQQRFESDGSETIIPDTMIVAETDGYYEIPVAKNGALIFRVGMINELREVNSQEEIDVIIEEISILNFLNGNNYYKTNEKDSNNIDHCTDYGKSDCTGSE